MPVPTKHRRSASTKAVDVGRIRLQEGSSMREKKILDEKYNMNNNDNDTTND